MRGVVAVALLLLAASLLSAEARHHRRRKAGACDDKESFAACCSPETRSVEACEERIDLLKEFDFGDEQEKADADIEELERLLSELENEQKETLNEDDTEASQLVKSPSSDPTHRNFDWTQHVSYPSFPAHGEEDDDEELDVTPAPAAQSIDWDKFPKIPHECEPAPKGSAEDCTDLIAGLKEKRATETLLEALTKLCVLSFGADAACSKY
eukprot:gnl/Hemi2/9314_TR3247_c0_g1_i1.p1 gnl/Hemi2/9314_TR3247_c0_g1~~gnl/Hemi2/9314_TR3247_c0_g1_i1.p1  ORF type:complete len:224 (-),score=62.48 gnl/Hemi2/9314_TR3247_c0_g1_i1:122-754(-)